MPYDVGNFNSRFHWGMLRALGNSRLVTSSVAWLFVVPIAAKLLAPFAGQHTLDLSFFDPDLSELITVTIALPFSWQRFYLMSWLFVIGQGVYLLACPVIVRKYPNFGAYRADHASDGKLRGFIKDASHKRGSQVLERLVEATKTWGEACITAPFEDAKSRTHVSNRLTRRLQVSYEGVDDRRNDVFDVLLAAEQHAYRLWFCVSGGFFAGGLTLFAWVVVEGVIEVWKLL